MAEQKLSEEERKEILRVVDEIALRMKGFSERIRPLKMQLAELEHQFEQDWLRKEELMRKLVTVTFVTPKLRKEVFARTKSGQDTRKLLEDLLEMSTYDPGAAELIAELKKRGEVE